MDSLGYSLTILSLQNTQSHRDYDPISPYLNRSQCFFENNLSYESVDINNISSVFSKFSHVAGMRYHALLIAALLDIPFLGIYNDQKVKSLCDQYHMPCFHTNVFTKFDFVESLKNLPQDCDFRCINTKNSILSTSALSHL